MPLIPVLILLSVSILAGQANFSYTGLEVYQGRISLDDVKLDYEGGGISWFFTNGGYTYGHFALGLTEHKIITDLPESSDLNSKRQFSWNFHFTQVHRLFYGRAGINFYNISGDVKIQDGADEYLHDNVYQLMEFPMGYGIHMNLGQVLITAGYRTYYYYGKHHQKIYRVQADEKIKLDEFKKSFDDKSARFLETDLELFLSRSLYLHLGFTFDTHSKDKTSNLMIGFSL